MDTEKIIKEARLIMITCLTVGVILLGIGVTFRMLEINIINNNKAIIGLAFIPLAVAFTNYLKLVRIKKAPQKMREIIISHNDERLVAIKNEADGKAFRILQGIIFLTYMGYTLIVPKDIFESAGWWIILALLFLTFILQGIIYKIVSKRNTIVSEEVE
jgi:hypothetical protein